VDLSGVYNTRIVNPDTGIIFAANIRLLRNGAAVRPGYPVQLKILIPAADRYNIQNLLLFQMLPGVGMQQVTNFQAQGDCLVFNAIYI